LSGLFIWFIRLVCSSGSFVWFVRLIRSVHSSGSFVWFICSSEDNEQFLMSQARSLEIYNLDLDSKKLLRSLTRTAAAEYNECASGGCSHVTTGAPAGWEFVGA
jgi:hypothetical protein